MSWCCHVKMSILLDFKLVQLLFVSLCVYIVWRTGVLYVCSAYVEWCLERECFVQLYVLFGGMFFSP